MKSCAGTLFPGYGIKRNSKKIALERLFSYIGQKGTVRRLLYTFYSQMIDKKEQFRYCIGTSIFIYGTKRNSKKILRKIHC